MRKYVVLIFAILALNIAKAQNANQNNIQISYYGDMLKRPGFKVGYEKPIKIFIKTKSKNGIEKVLSKSYNIGLEFGYYYFQNHHHGFILSPAISLSKFKQSGKFTQWKYNLGYHRSIVEGKVYKIDANQNVVAKKLSGQNTIYNAINFLFGKDLRASKNVPLRYFAELGLSGRFPHNKTFLPSLNFGFGIHYFIKK